jgi:hypothetical protein|tara:strand:- start:4755 stop:5216 length:462 start_codon:yes stop_codon:yes gene_type:complete
MSDNSVVTKSKVIELQNELLKNVDNENIIGNNGEVVRSKVFPLKHSFVDGIYVRQMEMSKDSMVVGAIHNHEHLWFLLTGNIVILANEKTEEYIAPCYVKCPPGMKRVIYAVSDSIFVNIHKNPTNTQDLDKLEAEIVSGSYEEYEEYQNKNK